MNEKLCVFCRHFDWGGVDYTTYGTFTGGCIEGGFSCWKGVYTERIPEDTDGFRKLIRTAEGCEMYSPDTGGDEI